ncbi:MAG: TonB-dependent receptor [Pseudomonadota bacterium]|nr:TonB-dependent receptor [Pseudomonadota bacterium]
MSFFRIRSRAACLARVVTIAVFLPCIATAQTELGPVIVTGTREPQPLAQSAADIVVISAQTIRNSIADSIEDLLRRETGMQLTRNGGPGQTSGYFIRGASTSGTVVLIDGVRVGSATVGQAEFESISLAQVDHIEVLRGPASSLYGADAVGGVIQIFTRRGDGAVRVTGNAAIGAYRSREGDLGISGSQDPFDYAASMGQERSRGVSAVRPNDRFGFYNPDDDGYIRSFGNLRLGYSPAAGHRIGIDVVDTYLNAQYDSAEFNPPTYIADPSPDFRDHLHTSMVSGNYRGVISPLWTTTLQASKNIDDAESGGTTETRFKTDREQETWQNALHFGPDQQVMLAYEHLHEKASGDVFANGPERSNNAFVLGYSGRYGLAGLEASIRNDDNSVYGSNTTGSVGATYQVTTQFKLRALAGTTFRAPTFNDLFYPQYGVATVKPERGRSFEVGAAWQSGGTSATATIYRNNVHDLIGYDPDPNGTDCPPGYFGCAANTSRARLQGATLGAGQQWGGLEVRATVDLLDAKDSNTGARLVRRAAHQETVAVNYTRDAWSMGAALLDVGSRPDGGIVLGGYSVVDVRAAWRFKPAWRLEAKLLNALDHRVEPVRDYQGLGRQAWVGIRFDGMGL